LINFKLNKFKLISNLPGKKAFTEDATFKQIFNNEEKLFFRTFYKYKNERIFLIFFIDLEYKYFFRF
jgi:hypothetical protein